MTEKIHVYDKICRAVDDELSTDIIGACAAVMVESIIDSASDLATALRAFDALADLTRKRIVAVWNEYEHDQ